jgi:hypothetical protein
MTNVTRSIAVNNVRPSEVAIYERAEMEVLPLHLRVISYTQIPVSFISFKQWFKSVGLVLKRIARFSP